MCGDGCVWCVRCVVCEVCEGVWDVRVMYTVCKVCGVKVCGVRMVCAVYEDGCVWCVRCVCEGSV